KGQPVSGSKCHATTSRTQASNFSRFIFIGPQITQITQKKILQICGLGNGFFGFSHQVSETWIETKFLQVRIDAYERETDRMLAFSLREPAKRIVEVAKPCVDDCDLIRRHPALLTIRDDLVQDLPRFILF